MTVQPKYERFDPGEVLCEVLQPVAQGSVVLLRDADYRPDELMTVVQVPSYRPAGGLPGNRWAFRVGVTLVTTGDNPDVVLGECERLTDALMSHSAGGEVLIHTVSCDSEPLLMSPHNPSGAESASASFSLIMRRKEQAYG